VQIFDPEGEILDGASPELSKIRKSINGLRSRIIRTMQSLIQDSSLEKFLQDKFVTQRNDRYVLPIKDTCSSQVKGIVQGQSAKGSTIFVEPESVVPMSNELQLLIQEEKREIYRILSIYSDVINAASGYLLDNTSLLSEFDLRFAIGKLSRELHSEVPEIGEEPYLDLKAARHPLLILKLDDFSRVIPFELELGKDKDILIVSGPNTGGKTVLLKAVGLITLMALSGLPVPVDKKSKIGYFEPVYADVGMISPSKMPSLHFQRIWIKSAA
jgi:DNA mismatch repair protein MutS2